MLEQYEHENILQDFISDDRIVDSGQLRKIDDTERFEKKYLLFFWIKSIKIIIFSNRYPIETKFIVFPPPLLASIGSITLKNSGDTPLKLSIWKTISSS